MDVEPQTRGKKKLKTCTERNKDISFGGTLADLDLGDLILVIHIFGYQDDDMIMT
jgi:hypothetical protein